MIEKPYIVTYTGKKFHGLNPRPEEVCIEDIAHGLAFQSRFVGQAKEFYSIAQHSVIVSNLSPYPLQGLLHDASEAYLGDMPKPWKLYLPTFQYAEDCLQEVIWERFGLEPPPPIMKKIDNAVLRLEWEYLINNPEGHSVDLQAEDDIEMHWKLNGCWPPVEAERVFLKLFKELT